MIPENLQKLREQISLDGFKADPNCLYDATELNLLITEMTGDHSEAKTQLERAELRNEVTKTKSLEALEFASIAFWEMDIDEKQKAIARCALVLLDVRTEANKPLEQFHLEGEF